MKTKEKIILVIFAIVALLLSFLSTLHSQTIITADTVKVKQKPKQVVLSNQFRDYIEFKRKIDSIQNKIK